MVDDGYPPEFRSPAGGGAVGHVEKWWRLGCRAEALLGAAGGGAPAGGQEGPLGGHRRAQGRPARPRARHARGGGNDVGARGRRIGEAPGSGPKSGARLLLGATCVARREVSDSEGSGAPRVQISRYRRHDFIPKSSSVASNIAGCTDFRQNPSSVRPTRGICSGDSRPPDFGPVFSFPCSTFYSDLPEVAPTCTQPSIRRPHVDRPTLAFLDGRSALQSLRSGSAHAPLACRARAANVPLKCRSLAARSSAAHVPPTCC